MPELGCTSAVQNEKCIFHFVLLSATGACNYVLNNAGRRPRRHLPNQVRCPRVGMNSWNKCIAKSGIETPSWQMPTRGRVAPKLACVQDIRPHVPELGCTSAVQNEKCIFHFCTADATILARAIFVQVFMTLGFKLTRPRVAFKTLGRFEAPRVEKYMNTTNKSIANLGYQASSP